MHKGKPREIGMSALHVSANKSMERDSLCEI